MTEIATPIANFRVIWQKCLKLEKCVHIGWPINKTWCIGVKVCIRIVLEGGRYYVEVEANGHKYKWPVADHCYRIYSISIGHIDICIDAISGGVKIVAKACISAGPFNQCWTIYGVNIHFLAYSEIADKAQREGLTAQFGGELEPDTHFVIEEEFDTSGVVPECNCE